MLGDWPRIDDDDDDAIHGAGVALKKEVIISLPAKSDTYASCAIFLCDFF
jgi:hypothetical protein